MRTIKRCMCAAGSLAFILAGITAMSIGVLLAQKADER